MKTKIEAAQKATILGIDTIIINATKSEVFDYVLNGKLIGTIFKKNPNPIAAKKLWMLYALPASGKIFVDAGAARAIQKKGASLLPSGIIGVDGEFNQGDAVEIYVKDEYSSKLIAKGISQYNSNDLKKIKGKKSNQIKNILGYLTTEEIVHRDELVLIEVEQ